MSADPMTQEYFQKLKESINQLDGQKIQKAIEMLFEAYKNDKQIFILGNGGSAVTASHFACDLGKGSYDYKYKEGEKRFRVMALTDNIATIMAYGNDLSFDDVFIEQLKNLINGGDVVIGISGSGNSKNVIKAVEYAKEKGANTIGFLGFKTGGQLAGIVDMAVVAHDTHYGRIEDIHLSLVHLISEELFKLKNSQANKNI